MFIDWHGRRRAPCSMFLVLQHIAPLQGASRGPLQVNKHPAPNGAKYTYE